MSLILKVHCNDCGKDSIVSGDIDIEICCPFCESTDLTTEVVEDEDYEDDSLVRTHFF